MRERPEEPTRRVVARPISAGLLRADGSHRRSNLAPDHGPQLARRRMSNGSSKFRVPWAPLVFVVVLGLAFVLFHAEREQRVVGRGHEEVTRDGTRLIYSQHRDDHGFLAGRSTTGTFVVVIVHPRHLLYRSFSTQVEVRRAANDAILACSASRWIDGQAMERFEFVVPDGYVGNLSVRSTEILLPYAGLGDPAATEFQAREFLVPWR